MKKTICLGIFILFIAGTFSSCSVRINKEKNAGYFKNYRDAINFVESKGFNESHSIQFDDCESEDIKEWLHKFPNWIDGFDKEDHVMSKKQARKAKGYFIVLLYDKEEDKWNQALVLHKEFISTFDINWDMDAESSWGDSWIRYYFK